MPESRHGSVSVLGDEVAMEQLVTSARLEQSAIKNLIHATEQITANASRGKMEARVGIEPA